MISHVRKLSRGPLVAKPVVRTPPARYDDPWGVMELSRFDIMELARGASW